MRVVVVTTFSWPKPGGLERVIELEVRELARRGHEVHLVCATSEQDPQALLKDPRIAVHRGPYRYLSWLPGFLPALFFAIWMAPTVRRLARGGAPVHAHNTWAAICAILAGARRRTALHVHSIASEDWRYMEAQKLPLMTRALLRVDGWANLVAEILTYGVIPAILPVTEYEAADVQKKTRHPERVHLVRNGVDTDTFHPDEAARAALRRELAWDENELMVLFLGRFVPKNGTVFIAGALPEANKLAGPAARWVFVGKGTEEPQMRSIIEKSGATNVRWLPPQDSLRYYQAADVFISHLNAMVEGQGLTVIEAMACGIPVVTGRDPISVRIFEDGKEIVLVRKDDPAAAGAAVDALLRDPESRRAIGRAARERVVADLSVRAQVDLILKHLTR